MTPSELAELDRKIAVMQASKTEQIEMYSCGAWRDVAVNIIKWNWAICDYRVKGESSMPLSELIREADQCSSELDKCSVEELKKLTKLAIDIIAGKTTL